MFASDHTLFPADIKSNADVEEAYDIFCSLRRGSDSRAIDENVSRLDIEIINRWKAKESSGNRKAAMKGMVHVYADVELLKNPFLCYTKAM